MTDQHDLALPVVAPSGSFANAILRFARELREHGLNISPACSLQALAAVAMIDLQDRNLFRQALSLSLIKRPQDRVPFELLFDAYWRFERESASDDIAEAPTVEIQDESTAENLITEELVDKVLEGFSYETFWQEEDGPQTSDDSAPSGTDAESHELGDVSSAINDHELKRLVRALQDQFSTRHGRRFAPDKRGHFLDLRRSMQNSVRYGGVPLELAWLRRKPQRSKIILFVDVSRSMASYAKLLLQFAGSVLRHAWQVEVLLFASTIKRVSSTQLNDNEADFNQIIAECGGGTRIGENLLSCLNDYPELLSGARNIVLILSDGLDRGDGDALQTAMRRLSSHARQLIWLNPMLGNQSYADATREMSSALAYIDVLAPAHDAASLWGLLEILKSGSKKPNKGGQIHLGSQSVSDPLY